MQSLSFAGFVKSFGLMVNQIFGSPYLQHADLILFLAAIRFSFDRGCFWP